MASSRKTLLLLIVLSIAPTLIAAPGSRHKGYRTEFHDPVRGAPGVFALDVIFSRRTSAREAEAVLREEVARIIRLRHPNGDVLANAWYSPTGQEIDEDLITLPDGSSHLIYWRKLHRTITFNEYERRTKK